MARIGGVSLLIIDPIVSAVAGDMHRANDVRRSQQAVVDFAEADADGAGYAWATVRRAQKSLGILAIKGGMKECWTRGL